MINAFKSFYYRHIKTKELDIFVRNYPVVLSLKKGSAPHDKILEVGSGDMGISAYLNADITGADISFSDNLSGRLKKVLISSVRLPFADNSFDHVVTVDMLEHVEKDQRALCVAEMIRVCRKKLIIVVPAGGEAERHDVEIDKLYFNTFKFKLPWLLDHLKNGLPTETEVFGYLSAGADKAGKIIKVVSSGNTNIAIRRSYLGLAYNRSPAVRTLFKLSILPVFVILKMFPLLLNKINSGECYRKMFVAAIE